MSIFPIRFTVFGTPATAGSKRAIPFKRSDGSLGANVIDDNRKNKPWQSLVIAAARDVYDGPLLDEPLCTRFVFFLKRPKSHYRTGRNRHLLSKSAPAFPAVKPDITKLVRSIEDALKGVVWHDDSRVVQSDASKLYGEPERCEVCIISASEDCEYSTVTEHGRAEGRLFS